MAGILIVDDDTELHFVLEGYLEPIAGRCPIEWASTPQAAQAYLEEHHPDLILSDHHFQESQTGIDLWTHCLKKHPEVGFVLISGYPGDLFSLLVEQGLPCPPFLPKPFNRSEFHQVLRRCVPQYFPSGIR